MSEHNKRPCPGAGTPGQDQEKAANLCGSSNPVSDSTLNRENRQGRVSSVLGVGREAATSMKALIDIFGVDERAVRRLISAERQVDCDASDLILSDARGGYYRPGNLDEVRRFVRSMQHRAAEVMRATRTAERALNVADGQEVIAGWFD